MHYIKPTTSVLRVSPQSYMVNMNGSLLGGGNDNPGLGNGGSNGDAGNPEPDARHQWQFEY